MRTALVTGCAGFIGSNLVDMLLEKRVSVVGVDDLRTGRLVNLTSAMNDDRFQFIEQDIASDRLHSSVKAEFDVVFHLAAISSVAYSLEDPIEVNKVNVEGTLNVLELARRRGADRVVFSSSAAVYGNPTDMPVTEETETSPLSPYAASKLSAEHYVKAYRHSHSLESVVLRYFNIYGPRQAFSEYSGVISIFSNNALQGKDLIIEGDGKQTRSFVFVEDVCDATIKAGERREASGETINISGTEATSIVDLAGTVLGLAAPTDSQIKHAPPRKGDVRKSFSSTYKAERVLGLADRTPFEVGLRRTVQWYREHT